MEENVLEIYIIRHGETYWNAKKKIQGFSDIELNDNGVELAKHTGERLADTEFDYVYSSPLKRAHKTAELVTQNRYEIIDDDRLKEICLGDYEGRVMSEIGEEFKKFFDAPEEFVPVNGERFEEVIFRTKEFFDKVIIPLEGKADRVLIASHAAAIKCMLSWIKKVDVKDLWCGPFIKNCAISIVELKNGELQLKQEGIIL